MVTAVTIKVTQERRMERQFTATVYIVENDRVLLIHHKKLRTWLPPGGHIDPNETPPEAAKREAFEETGLEIEFIPQENIWIDRWNAKSFERPYLCLLENIPEHKGVPAHQHMDLVYLARPSGGQLRHNDEETHDIRWFSWEELQALEPDKDIFMETLETIKVILARFLRR
jgi:8-oxo-dGTP pyrophosphatase MutT (NUDIX family)